MKNIFSKPLKIVLGVALSAIIALLACFLESLLPVHVIGAAVIAMFIGMLLNYLLRKTSILSSLSSGIKFTSKKVLKLAIILLGLSLKIRTILTVGRMSLLVMIFTFTTLSSVMSVRK